MAFHYYNPNPAGIKTDDCQIRAVTKALGMDWDTAYIALSMTGFRIKREQDSKATMWAYLHARRFVRYPLPDTCPDCYTVAQFARDHPHGIFILGTDSHIVCIQDGDWYDTWDSQSEVPLFVWVKEDSL